MKTKDIEKLGITRNFLRACIKHDLIKPKKIDKEWINNEDYVPYEYSQKDIEIVWNASLFRHMGLSFNEIKGAIAGENIKLRDSLIEKISIMEDKIAELQAMVNFMKYIKGLGIDFIPSPPEDETDSKCFAEYLNNYIEYIDGDKKLIKLLNVMETFSGEKDLDNISDEKAEELEHYLKENISNYNSKNSERIALHLYKLKELIGFAPDSQEVQSIVNELFRFQKTLDGEDLSAWEFGCNYYFFLEEDTDISVTYVNMIGREAVELLKKGILEFLVINCPDKIRKNNK